MHHIRNTATRMDCVLHSASDKAHKLYLSMEYALCKKLRRELNKYDTYADVTQNVCITAQMKL